eukprot:1671946-Amphidinium_carterae.1
MNSVHEVQEPTLMDSIQLFRSAVVEPYETVFADPPPADGRHRMWSGSMVPNDLAGSTSDDLQLMIRNLDTGEVRRLGDGALSLSFAGASPQTDFPKEVQPWKGWWNEKRQRDEQLWLASAA